MIKLGYFPARVPRHPCMAAGAAIVDDETFERAQELLASPKGTVIVRRPYPTDRPYALRSLLSCGLCDRRMQGSWNNGQAYYRCRVPNQERQPNHPRGVYLREAVIVPPLNRWLIHSHDQSHLPEATAATITAVASAQPHDRAVLYTQLGLRLRYLPDQGVVAARMEVEPSHGTVPCIGPIRLEGLLVIE